MITRRLLALATWAVVAGCALALGDVSIRAWRIPAQPAPAVSDPPAATAPRHDALRIDRQMSALDRHARFDMILYSGDFYRGELAATTRELALVAVALDVGK
jgi:hypothetical protein